jgi:hypothetical protein
MNNPGTRRGFFIRKKVAYRAYPARLPVYTRRQTP